ncbi:MAG: T9SS type A sorting domain-containing protein [Bacteroidales bacterium]|nr:T9SS type A sorting domain-containing protein [Bacteroidales bacterium]
MVTSNDGGVFFSSDVNHPEPSFREINKDYNTLQFYTCALGPDQAEPHYLGGTQDDGTLYYNGSSLSMNSMVAGGDGSFCCFDQTINRPLIVSAFYNSYYFFPDGIITQYADFKWTGIFINPADYDYLNHTLYANAVTYDQVYPGSIVVISGIPYQPVGQILDLNTGTDVPFSILKVSPFSEQDNTTLFLGTQSGRCYKAIHLQDDPDISDIGSSKFPAANLSCIDIGESEQELLVTFSNFGVASVWLSLDGGNTWMNKEGTLPDIPVRWGVFHQENTHQVMLATELGVWVTEDIRATDVLWSQSGDGLPNVRTDMVRIRKSDNKTLAATHGRGIFTTTYPVALPEIPTPETTLTISPNPAPHTIHITGGSEIEQKATIRIYSRDGHLELSQSINCTHETADHQLDISFLADGIYLLTFTHGAYTETGKLIKIPSY